MSKYSDEFKLVVIKYCIDERNGVEIGKKT